MTAATLAGMLLLAGGAVAGDPPVRVLESQGRWESPYGEHFYNVVGRLRNDGTKALRWVKLRVDAVDEAGRSSPRPRPTTRAPGRRRCPT